MEKSTFAKQMAQLSAACECTITKERVAVFWDQLGILPDSAFAEGVVAHVNVSRQFPMVCELRELAQAVIRRTSPKVLEPPRVSTETSTIRTVVTERPPQDHPVSQNPP